MRRLVAATFLLGALTAPLAASAASPTLKYTGRSFGFSVRYPSGWQVSSDSLLKQVLFSHQGKQIYGFDVAIVSKVSPSSSIAGTLTNLKRYERKLRNKLYVSARWSQMKLGGKAAEFAALPLKTEGGVKETQATIVATWKAKVLEVTFPEYGKVKVTDSAQFPSAYRQILSSWKWIK